MKHCKLAERYEIEVFLFFGPEKVLWAASLAQKFFKSIFELDISHLEICAIRQINDTL